MLVRFCLYSILKNLRFADPFIVLFLLDIDYSYSQIGFLLGFERLLTGLLEVPTGVLADRWGRRRVLAGSFLLYTAAFLLYARAVGLSGVERTVWIYGGITVYALGEAFRTGSHKAIMLDWLDSRGESSQATRLIAVTRFCSKTSAGLAALLGGLVLYLTHQYRSLFLLSSVAAASGFLLMLSYPRHLEGEQHRETGRGVARPSLRKRLALLAALPGILPLFLQSILFESQARMLLRYYLQPFLKEGLEARGFVIVGAGALWVGLNESVRDGLGGVGAWFSPAFERHSGGTAPALRRAYVFFLPLSMAVGLCYYQGWMLAGLGMLVLVTMLQNARRPIFVSAFNRVMDKPQRATTLSIESQSRSLGVAVLLPLMGMIADQRGIGAVFLIISAILAAGLLIRLPARQA